MRLKQILTTREQWGELEAMYERAITATTNGARQAELLSEVALVAEEITNERPKAIRYYERILELDPIHEQAIRSLDSLYAQEERWENLAILLTRRLGTVASDEQTALKLRLGTLLYTRLGDPKGARSMIHSKAFSASRRRTRTRGSSSRRSSTWRSFALGQRRCWRPSTPSATTSRSSSACSRSIWSSPGRRTSDVISCDAVADLRDGRLRDDAGAFRRVRAPRSHRSGRRAGEGALAGDRAARSLRRTRSRRPHPRREGRRVPAATPRSLPTSPRSTRTRSAIRRVQAVYREVLELAPEDAQIADLVLVDLGDVGEDLGAG